MTWNGFIEWFFTMGVIVLIFATPWIADLFRHFGDRGGGPTHPLPVTSSIETEHRPKNGSMGNFYSEKFCCVFQA